MICKQKNCQNEVKPPRKVFCSRICCNRHSSAMASKRKQQRRQKDSPTIICGQKNCSNIVQYPKRVFCSRSCKNIQSSYTTREKNRRLATERAGGKCQACGYDRCVQALEFHHLDSAKKDFAVASSTKSWEEIKREVDKCILLCANCHREVHCGMLKVSDRAVTPAR